MGPNDLTDSDSVKSWLGIKADNSDDDALIDLCISGFSQYVLNRTGRDSFTNVASYVEIYDGNGAQRIFLRNTPIVTVNSIIAGAHTLPQSSGLNVAGWFIEQSQKSIAIRCGPTIPSTYVVGQMPIRFPAGIGNVQVDYTAGYAVVPDDLAEATIKAVAINYRRKDWIDLASKTISTGGGAGSGTTAYRNWALPPEIERVIAFYTRRALV